MLATNALDIGIKPAAGLHPQKLRIEEALTDSNGKSDS